MKYLYIFLTFLLCSCANTPDEINNTDVDNNKANLYSVQSENPFEKADHFLTLLDSINFAPYSDENIDILLALNDSLENIAMQCAILVLNNPDSVSHDYEFNWSISPDNNFGIISWNTRLGGTWINIEHLKFWKSDGEVNFQSSMNIELDEGDMFSTYYTSIHEISTNANNTIYLCKGQGQASSMMPWRSIEAFGINEQNEIDTLYIFPGESHSQSVHYDFAEKGNFEDMLEFEINTKFEIKAPQYDFNTNTLQVHNLVFNGEEYIDQSSYDSYIPLGFDVLSLEYYNLYGHDENAGLQDIVMILRDSVELDDESMDMDIPRPLIVLKANKNGYEVVARGENIVMCHWCGGVFGDPFDYLKLSKGIIAIGHYGGSNAKWYENYVFELDDTSDQWALTKIITGGHNSSDEDGDGEIDMLEEVVKTSKDFGIILLSEFDYMDAWE